MKQVQIDNLQRTVPFDAQMRGNMTQAVQAVFYTAKGVTAPLEVQISLVEPRKPEYRPRNGCAQLSVPGLGGRCARRFYHLGAAADGEYGNRAHPHGGYRHFHAPRGGAGGGLWPQPDAGGLFFGRAWRAAPFGL